MSDDEIRRQLVGYSCRFKDVTVPPAELIRRRLRRRRIKLAAVNGSAAVMLVAGAVGAAAALPAWRLTGPANSRHHATASPLGWVPAGPELPANATPDAAPYLVTLGLWHHRGLRAVVHDWRTGAFLGQVRPPDGRCFQQIAGASDDRTFLLLAAGCRRTIRTWFYELRLTPSGHPEPLIPISLPLFLHGTGTFALSPDGAHLAFALIAPEHQPSTSTVTVYDLMTGAKRTWSGPGLVLDVAWAGDRTLAISVARNGRTVTPTRLRLLEVTAPGSSLLDSRELGPYRSGFPLPAAKNVIYAPRNILVRDTVWNELVRNSARTGRLEIIWKPFLLKGLHYTWCDPVWTDGSGEHALAACGMPAFYLRLDGNHMSLTSMHFPVEYMEPAMNAYYFAF